MLARVRVAKAVPWIEKWVRLATMAPAGPEVPVATSMARAMTTSCGTPGAIWKASDSSTQLIRQ
ncbi:hypothetical protein D9M71_688260 [compost metagenome]